MKAKLKPHKLLSMLLALVMVVGMLPTTALATTYNDVKVNGVSLGDGEYLTSNAATTASSSSTEPSSYVAWYKDGVLTLNNFTGKSNSGIVLQGAPAADLIIKLIGNNTITPYDTGIQGNSAAGSITITADSGSNGKLTINMPNSERSAFGINGSANSVTISGSADVTIIATATATNQESYGIKSSKAVSISENASVNITCKTPNSTSRSDSCNGIYSDTDVTINTDGTIQIDVHEAGNEAYSYGINSMGTLTLTKVGEMTVEWKKASMQGAPYYPITASFSGTDHAINVDEDKCFASYRHGTPHTVTVENGTLTGPGVPNAEYSGKFLENDTVNITADTKTGRSGENIPFKGWTSSDVTLTSPTMENNSFTVANKDVTVTATYNPFDESPTFTPTGSTNTTGTLTFKTVVKADATYEGFRLVKEGNENNESSYNLINPDTTSTFSPYEYSYETSIYSLDEGNYYVAELLDGTYYLSEKFTVSYTAAPTVTYPDHVRVYNASGAITSLNDGQCLVTNAGKATDYTASTSYVARYDSGTLYLKDYHGVAADGKIYANGDLNIVVESNSSFTTSRTSTDDLYGIQANGNLNISGSGKLTVTANGDGNVYGIYAKEGVTISAPLDVRVGKVDSSKNGPVHGIYTQSGALSLSDKDKTITATGGTEAAYGVYNKAQTSSTAADNGNINISGKLTVNLRNGSNNRGISSEGGVITLDGATVKIPGSYYYGIFNKNGNVVIKSTSDVDISSDISGNNGICTYSGGDLTIQNSTVKVSAHGYAANQKGKLSIKNSIVALTRNAEEDLVVNTANDAANTIDLSGSGSVTLTASGKQTDYAMISGTVSLGTNTKL